MTTVVDASVVVAALIDTGPDGSWAETLLAQGGLFAPDHLFVEAASALRRAAAADLVSQDGASLAHDDLLDLAVEIVPYQAVAERAWGLRANVSTYDAAYVALAEQLDLPLATLDGRLRRAPGVHCRFVPGPG